MLKRLIDILLVRLDSSHDLHMVIIYFFIKLFQTLFDLGNFGFEFGLTFLQLVELGEDDFLKCFIRHGKSILQDRNQKPRRVPWLRLL